MSLVTKIIQEQKLKHAFLVCDLNYLSSISDDDFALNIDDGQFLELVLFRIRGKINKYASYCKKTDAA